jgi:UV DNA damage repair endonuclease
VGVRRHSAATVDHGDEMEKPMVRLGLCCTFRDQPIKFVNTTATAIGRIKRTDAQAKLAWLCAANAVAIFASLRFCADHGIGDSPLSPVMVPSPRMCRIRILVCGLGAILSPSAGLRNIWLDAGH